MDSCSMDMTILRNDRMNRYTLPYNSDKRLSLCIPDGCCGILFKFMILWELTLTSLLTHWVLSLFRIIGRCAYVDGVWLVSSDKPRVWGPRWVTITSPLMISSWAKSAKAPVDYRKVFIDNPPRVQGWCMHLHWFSRVGLLWWAKSARALMENSSVSLED